MKKVLLVLVAMFVAGSISFAAEKSGEVKSAKSEVKKSKEEVLTFAGVVESNVTSADKKAKTEIVVVADKEKKTFIISPKTTLYATKDAKDVITLDKIVKGDKVTVKYKISKEKTNIAVMITK